MLFNELCTVLPRLLLHFATLNLNLILAFVSNYHHPPHL
jgi:hypothetical protein